MISIKLDRSPSLSSYAVAPGSTKLEFLKISIVDSPINVIMGGVLSNCIVSDSSASELEQDKTKIDKNNGAVTKLIIFSQCKV